MQELEMLSKCTTNFKLFSKILPKILHCDKLPRTSYQVPTH